MRKNRVRDKANFTKGDVALSRAKRFYFFWVCPKEIKKNGKLGNLGVLSPSLFWFCAVAWTFQTTPFTCFCVWCFRFCAKAWTNETTFHLASLFFGVWVASQFFKKTTVFFLNQTNWVCLLLCKPGLKFMSRARLKPVGWVVGASVFHRTYSRPAQVPPRE